MAGRYETFLCNLLKPLGLYRLESGTINESELYAVGAVLDEVSELLEYVERESVPATAEGEGLSRREVLFARKPAAQTVDDRRRAIAALNCVNGDSFTPAEINRILNGCGIRAEARETGSTGRVRVVFPDVMGIPPEFEQVKDIILDLIPCHLETEFWFRYLTWKNCEIYHVTFSEPESEKMSWTAWETWRIAERG